jgi:hypothetical protein
VVPRLAAEGGGEARTQLDQDLNAMALNLVAAASGTRRIWTGPLTPWKKQEALFHPSTCPTARLGAHHPYRHLSLEGTTEPVGPLQTSPPRRHRSLQGYRSLAWYFCQSVRSGPLERRRRTPPRKDWGVHDTHSRGASEEASFPNIYRAALRCESLFFGCVGRDRTVRPGQKGL